MAEQPKLEQETEGGGLSHQAPAPAQIAMKQPRRTEITVEYNQVVVIRRPEGLVEAWCDRCAERVNMITTEAAAVLANSDTRAIYRRIEAGAIHFAETPEGMALVCLNSLLR